jgi:hypothetical protein
MSILDQLGLPNPGLSYCSTLNRWRLDGLPVYEGAGRGWLGVARVDG